ncbi:MAG TPA: PH domain-containing protein [Thermoanaerobaculia bacterium]|nr:PH domain-containing protein [Thermoanaerobaculia bacterium]
MNSEHLAAGLPVALPYRIRSSALRGFFPLGPGYAGLPWRGFALALLLSGGWLFVSTFLELSDRWTAIGLSTTLLVGIAAAFSESVFRTDYLTAAGLERTSGVLGRKREVIPYGSIELVKIEEPGLSAFFDVGDVILRASGREHRLAAVVEPYELASAFESLRRMVAINRPSGT